MQRLTREQSEIASPKNLSLELFSLNRDDLNITRLVARHSLTSAGMHFVISKAQEEFSKKISKLVFQILYAYFSFLKTPISFF